MTDLVILQRQVSQLDEPVYARISRAREGAVHVVYWNDYGFRRSVADPELGIVPDFDRATELEFPKQWLDSRSKGLADVAAAIASLAPGLVVMSDIPRRDRAWLASRLRRTGRRVALRSDKNELSATATGGLKRAYERWSCARQFDLLAPVSPLTTNYYAWPEDRLRILFPYATDETKFAPDPGQRSAARTAIRVRLGIPPGHHVFVSAAKFVGRENPWAVVKCFEAVAARLPDVSMIALGDGPLLPEIRQYRDERGLKRLALPGYVPFRQLQDYFFASDTFVHLAEIEPWGVSVQDAVVAGLSLVTSDRVGSGMVFLDGALARFRVPLQGSMAEDRMLELATAPSPPRAFADARKKAEGFTVAATAARWTAAI